ncbi:TPA: energy transducer TonB [Klebsiella variicola]|nr:energy transducer TonB [Klebsiella variicola]
MKISYLLLAVALVGCGTRPANTIKFPERAYNLGVYGTVHVQYDIDKAGRVENIVVEDDEEGFFTKQIVADMKHWQLEAGCPKKAQILTVAFERDRAQPRGGFLEN